MSKMWVIMPFAFLQLAALSTNLYIVPQLVVSKICYRKFNHTICTQLGHPRFKIHEDYVFEEAAAWNALINFAGFFPAVFLTLPLGAMTDLVSKKKMLLLPAIFNLLSCVINLFSSTFVSLHVGFLVFASFVTCIFGELPGCITFCCAYAASTSIENRTLALTLTMASIELGTGVGSLVGNYLVRYYGYSSAFLLATAGLIVALLYLLMLIPPTDDDSVAKKSNEGEKYDLWNGIKDHTIETWHHLMLFAKQHILNPTDQTIGLLLISTLFNSAGYGGERSLIALFLNHSPLNFRAHEIGIYLWFFQFSRVTGLIVLAFVLRGFLKISDYPVMIIGVSSMTLSFAILGLSQTSLMVYLSTIFVLPGAFFPTSTRSLLTKLVTDNERGVSLSLYGLLQSITLFLMSLVCNGLFAATAEMFSGFSIMIMSFLNFVAFGILSYMFFVKSPRVTLSQNYCEVLKKDDMDQQMLSSACLSSKAESDLICSRL